MSCHPLPSPWFISTNTMTLNWWLYNGWQASLASTAIVPSIQARDGSLISQFRDIKTVMTLISLIPEFQDIQAAMTDSHGTKLQEEVDWHMFWVPRPGPVPAAPRPDMSTVTDSHARGCTEWTKWDCHVRGCTSTFKPSFNQSGSLGFKCCFC